MKFLWTTLTVKDMAQSLGFYEGILGLKINKRFKTPLGDEFVFLGEGETTLELICYSTQEAIQLGAGITVGFEVPSVEDMMAYLITKGVPVHSGPFQPNPHMEFFFVEDPNGLKVQLVEYK